MHHSAADGLPFLEVLDNRSKDNRVFRLETELDLVVDAACDGRPVNWDYFAL